MECCRYSYGHCSRRQSCRRFGSRLKQLALIGRKSTCRSPSNTSSRSRSPFKGRNRSISGYSVGSSVSSGSSFGSSRSSLGRSFKWKSKKKSVKFDSPVAKNGGPTTPTVMSEKPKKKPLTPKKPCCGGLLKFYVA